MGRRTVLRDIGQYLGDLQSRRTWSLAAQDGIISTAGILLGFNGAGASEATLMLAGTAAIVAGMLTAGGAKWSEMAAEREAQLRAIDEERLEYRQQRHLERDAVIAYYAEKGLELPLATEVADRLMRRSPLKAALESEHGILRITSHAEAATAGVTSAAAFGLGATIPFAIAYYIPLKIEIWLISFAVFISLCLTSAVGAQAGHMNLRKTILRTLTVASITIVVSYAVGDIAF